MNTFFVVTSRGDQPDFQVKGDTHTYGSSTPGVYMWQLMVCDVMGKCAYDKTQEFEFKWVPPPTMKPLTGKLSDALLYYAIPIV